jgi:N6-adenosine-specific RNA methylase IME4
MTQPLTLYDKAQHALAKAKRVDEVKSIRHKAVAMQVYAKQAQDRRLIEDATEIRLRAERCAGELLREMAKRKERDTGKGNRNPSLKSRRATPKLADLGVTKTQSSRWQQLADLDDTQFEKQVETARDKAGNSLNSIHREIKRRQKRETYATRTEQGCTVVDLQALADSGAQFGVIYPDLPSDYFSYFEKGKERSADQYYDSINALGPLIRELAAPDCALFLCTTWSHLRLAFNVLDAWDFKYSTCAFDWVKTNLKEGTPVLDDLKDDDIHFGMGHAPRLGTEPVLFATRGSPFRLENSVPQVVIAPVGAHSEKPEEIRRRIERLFPGPYLQLFGRKLVPGWVVWGQEIARAELAAPAAAPSKSNIFQGNGETSAEELKAKHNAAAPVPEDLSIPPFLRRPIIQQTTENADD